MVNQILKENFKQALKSIRSHLLRAILTMFIVSLGIVALIGTLTAIESLKGSLSGKFMSMGSNTFSIKNKGGVRVSNHNKRSRYRAPIGYKEALEFKRRFELPGITSINTFSRSLTVLKYKNHKTNPNINIVGIDENYLETSGNDIQLGRNFSEREIQSASHSIILGSEISKKLFPSTHPIDKIISVGAAKYKVIGVLKEKGASMGFGGDRNCYISLSQLRQKYYTPNMSFTVNFMAPNPQVLDLAVDEATGVFRIIRKLKTSDENNFYISRSDNLVQQLEENLSTLNFGAYIIAFITLLGASVGLMNIMLVSVSERTREIGLRMAVGATPAMIRNQFLIEAVVITEMGCLLGIVMGIGLGNFVSSFVDGVFIMPWFWIFISLIVSTTVGLISGLYPAIKASKTDPIESLRFE
ncbi:MAG: ABC transporter permease [Bacteroidales bacterium]|nr:ABC transporter permease [Bacteroidales bacterium]